MPPFTWNISCADCSIAYASNRSISHLGHYGWLSDYFVLRQFPPEEGTRFSVAKAGGTAGWGANDHDSWPNRLGTIGNRAQAVHIDGNHLIYDHAIDRPVLNLSTNRGPLPDTALYRSVHSTYHSFAGLPIHLRHYDTSRQVCQHLSWAGSGLQAGRHPPIRYVQALSSR